MKKYTRCASDDIADKKAKKASVNHADAIYRYLEQEIVSGRLEPGAKLDDAALAKRFGVSKTPIREAFLQLAAIDFIQLRQRVGAIVAPLSLQRMIQMFEVMTELEGMCAGLAAARMTAAERDLLSRAAAACRSFSQQRGEAAYKAYAEANFNFHEIVYRGSHNDYLAEQASHLRKRLAPYRRFWLACEARLRKSCAEHEQITQAILAYDEAHASYAMKRHLTMHADLANLLLGQLPPSYLTLVK